MFVHNWLRAPRRVWRRAAWREYNLWEGVESSGLCTMCLLLYVLSSRDQQRSHLHNEYRFFFQDSKLG